MIEILNSKPYTLESVSKGIIAYGGNEPHPTFRGLIVYLRLNNRKLKGIQDLASSGDKEAMSVIDLLDDFKLAFEAQLESYLVYQGRHEDLKDSGFINYNNYKFILEKMNPATYGRLEVEKANNSTQAKDAIFINSSNITLGDKK